MPGWGGTASPLAMVGMGLCTVLPGARSRVYRPPLPRCFTKVLPECNSLASIFQGHLLCTKLILGFILLNDHLNSTLLLQQHSEWLMVLWVTTSNHLYQLNREESSKGAVTGARLLLSEEIIAKEEGSPMGFD